MLGASGVALCTGYFMVHYRVRGDFESAYPIGHAMGCGMMEGMGMEHRMEHGMEGAAQ
jgi:hypothetical protein